MPILIALQQDFLTDVKAMEADQHKPPQGALDLGGKAVGDSGSKDCILALQREWYRVVVISSIQADTVMKHAVHVPRVEITISRLPRSWTWLTPASRIKSRCPSRSPRRRQRLPTSSVAALRRLDSRWASSWLGAEEEEEEEARPYV